MSVALILADLARDAARRRVDALMEIYRAAGFAPQIIAVARENLTDAAAGRLLSLDAAPGLLRPWAVDREAPRLAYARAAVLIHADRAVAPGPWARIGDRLLGGEGEADLALVLDRDASAREGGREAMIAPLLLTSARPISRVRRHRGALAGLWVADEGADVASAEGVLAHLKAAGATIRVTLGGPGAAKVRRPDTALGATLMPPDLNEEVFYRGVDILIAPSAAGGAPRLDMLEAMRLGAAPLAVEEALPGVVENWRLPRFRNPREIADYLGQKRDAIDGGGALAELRARADWTWSGLSAAALGQRERLVAKIRAMVRERRPMGKSA